MIVAFENKKPVFATFVERLNRFVAVVEIEKAPEKVHVPSTGRMNELLVAGARVVLTPANRDGRKTRYDLWAVDHGGVWVCVDSRAANTVAEKLLAASLEGAAAGEAFAGARGLRQALSGLVQGMTGFRKEARFGSHRFDFALLKEDAAVPVEVKSVNLVEQGIAKFPDAPTTRGASHLRALTSRAKDGKEAYALFIVQRSDARRFRPNESADPEFAAALAEAAQSGVGVVAVSCEVSPREIKAIKSLPVDLERS